MHELPICNQVMTTIIACPPLPAVASSRKDATERGLRTSYFDRILIRILINPYSPDETANWQHTEAIQL